MQDLSIRLRLWTMIAAFALMIVAGSALGLYGTRQGADAAGEIYAERTVPIAQLARLEATLMDARFAIDEALVRLNAMAALEQQLKTFDAEWTRFNALPRSPALSSRIEAMTKARAQFLKEVVDPLLAALKADDGEKARELAENKLPPLFMALRTQLGESAKLLVEEARGAHEKTQQRYRQMLLVVAGGLVLAFAGLVLYGHWLVRSITQPLDQAVRLAERVAAGDLSGEVEARGRNELAQLMRALQTMTETLGDIVSRVRLVADSIATGSSEIASGNADLSQRTEAQASNLQQTASAMEELSSTVRHNAEASMQANQLAGDASGAAQQGGEIVARAVGSMQGISDSSRRIADIIGTIDGIAFQTNILALNAAVEAARAGESGRGFAVVASEVRNLAQRSAEAAREIKALIGKSVEAVDTGSRQVNEAGQSMGEIVERVQRVGSLIEEITTASQEQRTGIERISVSVVELDQVTQANAALVEQSAAAAESLRRQAAQLVELMSTFKLR